MSNQRVPIDLPYSYLEDKVHRIRGALEIMREQNPNMGLPAIEFGLNDIREKAENIIQECNKLSKMAQEQHEHNQVKQDYPYLGD